MIRRHLEASFSMQTQGRVVAFSMKSTHLCCTLHLKAHRWCCSSPKFDQRYLSKLKELIPDHLTPLRVPSSDYACAMKVASQLLLPQ